LFPALIYSISSLTKREWAMLTAKPMPVPRMVSSSCGTCVAYTNETAIDIDGCELDSIYLRVDDALDCVLKK